MSSQRPHRARLVTVPAATTLALVLAGPASVAWADADQRSDKGPKGSGASQGSGTAGSGDPAGNNGTVKVDGVPLGDGRGNEPHVDCAFALDFYGFDAGQTADITFTGKAPTGSGTLLAQKGVAISDDAAGGGQDRDAVLTYTAEQLGLTGAAPHRNGWHVKVAVDVLEAPGGAKQKVFWLDCDRPAGTAGATTDTTSTGTEGTTSTTSAGTTTETTSTGATTGTTPTGTTVVDGAIAGAGTGTASGAGVAGVFAAAETATAVRGQSVSAAALPTDDAGAGALPTTGGELAMLVLLGLTAIGVGTAGVLAGRTGRTGRPTQPA